MADDGRITSATSAKSLFDCWTVLEFHALGQGLLDKKDVLNLRLTCRALKAGVNRILEDRTRVSVLHLACMRGHVDAVRKIVLKRPHMVDARDRLGRTPLHYVCMLCPTAQAGDVARILLAAGADGSARDADGMIPLALACPISDGGSRPVCEVCRQGGACMRWHHL